jgi:hypothetical protein
LSADAGTDAGSPFASAWDDIISVFATLYEIGWALRLYDEHFSDDQASPLGILENMFIIPIHFSVAAWELVNATLEELGYDTGAHALPPDLATTASGAEMQMRL